MKVILAATIVVGGVIAGIGTWAFWQDTDTSTDNTVEAGTMDLAINGSANGTTDDFNLVNAQPSDTVAQSYSLQNIGTTEAEELTVSFAVAENDLRSEPADSGLANELNANETASLIRVQSLTYTNPDGTSVDLVAAASDTNGNGYVDLEDIQAGSNPIEGLQPPAANASDTATLSMTLEVANDDAAYFTRNGNTAGNLTGLDEDIMADGVDIAVTFTLNQDASQ
ncbi:TasA family protein [Haladaptatus caseinilyticus]|uniref:TasA family protein n=1 Tax=Haladaptatus caseinilyticus TaxID=2993314 RepID=UPI00224A7D64|nr:TasA family protein [Haladaptatus caseinilyticus]